MLPSMNDSSFTLVAENPHFLVVAKRAGLPTVPLAKETGKKTLLSEVGAYFKEVLAPMGPHGHEGGVMHRLDTETCGLVLIARDFSTFDTLRESQMRGNFKKTYMAATKISERDDGYPPFPAAEEDTNWILESRFRVYGSGHKVVRPVTEASSSVVQGKGGKVTYRTAVELVGTSDEGILLYCCRLTRGFRHQVRCHLAWSSHAILGDQLYGGEPRTTLHLAAVTLGFNDPESEVYREFVWPDPPEWTSIT